MTSATGVPVSACFNANEICSSVNLLFFPAPLLPPGSHQTGKLVFMPEEKNGKTSDLRLVTVQSNTSPWRYSRVMPRLLVRGESGRTSGQSANAAPIGHEHLWLAYALVEPP